MDNAKWLTGIITLLLITAIVYAVQRLRDRAGRASMDEAQREQRRTLHLQIAVLTSISYACTSFACSGALPLCTFG